MAHNTTVFRQLLDLLPRHEFDAEARQHQEGPETPRDEPLGRSSSPSAWDNWAACRACATSSATCAPNPTSSITWACERSSVAPRWRG